MTNLLSAIAAALPAGYKIEFRAAETTMVDDEIGILKNGVDTGVAVQLGIDGICSIGTWKEDEGTLHYGGDHPRSDVKAIVRDLLKAIKELA